MITGGGGAGKIEYILQYLRLQPLYVFTNITPSKKNPIFHLPLSPLTSSPAMICHLGSVIICLRNIQPYKHAFPQWHGNQYQLNTNLNFIITLYINIIREGSKKCKSVVFDHREGGSPKTTNLIVKFIFSSNWLCAFKCAQFMKKLKNQGVRTTQSSLEGCRNFIKRHYYYKHVIEVCMENYFFLLKMHFERFKSHW